MGVYKVVDMNGNPVKTNRTLHPGKVLGEELEAREILQKDFAKTIGLQPPHLSDLIRGKRNVTARMALKLEKELGIEAGFWLRLQMAYDLFMAKKELQET
jgi:antitoxin HigA-1